MDRMTVFLKTFMSRLSTPHNKRTKSWNAPFRKNTYTYLQYLHATWLNSHIRRIFIPDIRESQCLCRSHWTKAHNVWHPFTNPLAPSLLVLYMAISYLDNPCSRLLSRRAGILQSNQCFCRPIYWGKEVSGSWERNIQMRNSPPNLVETSAPPPPKFGLL